MQLGKLLEETLVACGLQVFRRSATGGSTTTVIDTGLANKYGENRFAQGVKGGHILIISQTTDRAAPEGQFGEVSAYATPTTTPTFTVPTMAAAVASGDIYALFKPVVSIYEAISRINEALRKLTERERTDTSLTGLASTLAYTLPLPINQYNIRKVEMGNDTDGWADVEGFTIVPALGSTGDKLVFTKQPNYDATTAANQTIKITYLYTHPVLSIYSDYVEKNVPDELAISVCAEEVITYIMRQKPSYFTDETRMALYNNIVGNANMQKMLHTVRVAPPRRQSRINLRSM